MKYRCIVETCLRSNRWLDFLDDALIGWDEMENNDGMAEQTAVRTEHAETSTDVTIVAPDLCNDEVMDDECSDLRTNHINAAEI